MEILEVNNDNNFINIMPVSYLIVYGISIVFLGCMGIKYVKNRKDYQNHMRRKYIV